MQPLTVESARLAQPGEEDRVRRDTTRDPGTRREAAGASGRDVEQLAQLGADHAELDGIGNPGVEAPVEVPGGAPGLDALVASDYRHVGGEVRDVAAVDLDGDADPGGLGFGGCGRLRLGLACR